MKILVGYDGSNAAKEALNVGRIHAQAFRAVVHVVTSMQKGTEAAQKGIQEAELMLEWARSFFENQHISCKTHLLIRGLAPGEDLVTFARENGIKEIIVGVRRVRRWANC